MSHALHLYAMKLEMPANGFSLSCFFQPSRSGFWDSDEEKGDGGSGQLEEHCDPGLWQRCHLQEGTISEWPSFKMWNCINVVWQNKSHSDKNYSCPMILISVSFMALFISILLSCPDSQAVSIADKEVFSFRMVNFTNATDGDAYLDMSKVDTSVTLTVGCIQVIFLNKFVSSILVRITHPKTLNTINTIQFTCVFGTLATTPINFSPTLCCFPFFLALRHSSITSRRLKRPWQRWQSRLRKRQRQVWRSWQSGALGSLWTSTSMHPSSSCPSRPLPSTSL